MIKDFFSDPVTLVYVLLAFLTAITVHEYSHGRLSAAFGDPTPGMSGRLTLNPIKHLDPLGLIMILFAGIGWAKPVPVNPYYYGNPRRDMALVGLAGPIANFATAVILGRIGNLLIFNLGLFGLGTFIFYGVFINTILGLFNLVPIPPLDGSKILAYFIPDKFLNAYWKLEKYGILLVFAFVMIFRGVLWTVLTPLMDVMFAIAGVPGLGM